MTAPGLPYPVGMQAPNRGLAADLQAIADIIPLTVGETKTDVDVSVAPEHLFALATALRDPSAFAFDLLRNIAGVDLSPEGMALKYQFYSFRRGRSLQVTVPTAVGHPHVPSLVSIYPSADWHEREAAEMFGFVFDGHPNPRNLLLEEDLHIHPLLKAHPLQAVEVLQGIEEGPPGFKI
jgi:NADH-quinone oxidoreductase subunit C